MGHFSSYGHVGHVGQRFCSRCYKALTDAASMEVGVGPICRKLDNKLLAAKIPSDLAKAVEAYKSVNVGMLPPETVATFVKIESTLVGDDAAERLDWRETVKRIEWMRSFSMPSFNDKALVSIVASLGYIGIVAMWHGEAASGEATCSFVDGRLFVSGPQNKSFRIAFKKLPGWKFHAAKPGEERPSWSVAYTQTGGFEKLVMTHYPNNTGLGESTALAYAYVPPPAPVLEVAAAHAQMVTALGAVEVKPTAAAFATVNDAGQILLKTPYNTGFIVELKNSIPHGKRSWDGLDKVWKVAPEFKAQALAVLAKFFPAADVSAVQ